MITGKGNCFDAALHSTALEVQPVWNTSKKCRWSPRVSSAFECGRQSVAACDVVLAWRCGWQQARPSEVKQALRRELWQRDRVHPWRHHPVGRAPRRQAMVLGSICVHPSVMDFHSVLYSNHGLQLG